MPLVVLDFDETLVDVDSSEWVAQQLGVLRLFDALRCQGRPWHQAFNILLGTLHAEGTGIAQIQQALRRLPLHADTIAAIKASHALGCELLILSDANTFFVETVLHHHGLAPLFSHIYSNPAWIDEDGRLRYGSFHSVVSTDYDAADMMSPPGYPLPPHNCPFCPPNMCKGSVISAIRAAFCHNDLHDDAARTSSAVHTNEAAKNDGNGSMATIHDARVIQHIIYGGDGSGDFCPALRLLAEDFLLPRQGYPLSEMLFQNVAKVKARVRPWRSLGTTLQKAVEDALSLFKV